MIVMETLYSKYDITISPKHLLAAFKGTVKKQKCHDLPSFDFTIPDQEVTTELKSHTS